MVFALKENNYITLHMMQDYLDVGDELLLRDPDELGNYTHRRAAGARRPCVQRASRRRRSRRTARSSSSCSSTGSRRARKDNELVIVPTTSLYIECLVGTHPLLEDFKLIHRALDVKKVQAEVRHAELENIRLAARALKGKDEDPDIEKKIVIEGRRDRRHSRRLSCSTMATPEEARDGGSKGKRPGSGSSRLRQLAQPWRSGRCADVRAAEGTRSPRRDAHHSLGALSEPKHSGSSQADARAGQVRTEQASPTATPSGCSKRLLSIERQAQLAGRESEGRPLADALAEVRRSQLVGTALDLLAHREAGAAPRRTPGRQG